MAADVHALAVCPERDVRRSGGMDAGSDCEEEVMAEETVAKEMVVHNPMIVVYAEEGSLKFALSPVGVGNNYVGFAIMIAKLIRHTAVLFNVPEDAVRAVVEQELDQPSSKVRLAPDGA